MPKPIAPSHSASPERASAPLPAAWRDPWTWWAAASAIPLALAMRGAPWGEPVAEDFDFLHRALLQGMGTLLDGGGSQAFWRPIPHQLYYAGLGPTLVSHPWIATVLHLVLLALGAALVTRALRPSWPGPLAMCAGAFALGAESTRTIAGWPTQFVDVGLFVASALAVHAASRRRWPLALGALTAALLCKEVAVVTAVLLPFVPGAARDTRERLRRIMTTGVVVLVWGAVSLGVRTHAGLELPRRIAGSDEALSATLLDRLAWATHGSAKALASLPLAPSPDDRKVAGVALAFALIALVVFARSATARERLVRLRAWIAWGLVWTALATATLAPIFPSWQPNRAQYASLGTGVASVAVLGAAHPALALAFTGARLAALARAPRAASTVTAEPPETGAFMDWPRLTRLQRFMRATRTRLRAAYPTLPPGAVVVQQNLPHGVEYAFGADHALQVWYRDGSLRWSRFDTFASNPDAPATVILQCMAEREPPVALVSPSAVRDLFAARDLVTTGRPEQVLERLDRADAAQRDPDAIPYWVTSRALRAHAWASLGRAAAAESLVVSVLPLDPDDRAARQVLVIALLDQGKWAAAATQLDTLRAADPGDAATRALTERLRRLAP